MEWIHIQYFPVFYRDVRWAWAWPVWADISPETVQISESGVRGDVSVCPCQTLSGFWCVSREWPGSGKWGLCSESTKLETFLPRVSVDGQGSIYLLIVEDSPHLCSLCSSRCSCYTNESVCIMLLRVPKSSKEYLRVNESSLEFLKSSQEFQRAL